ncbi:hypothetical protein [Bradyrhizobium sp. MOS002]
MSGRKGARATSRILHGR